MKMVWEEGAEIHRCVIWFSGKWETVGGFEDMI